MCSPPILIGILPSVRHLAIRSWISSDARVQSAVFQRTWLRWSVFNDADMSCTEFHDTQLGDADFTGARMPYAVFDSADLTGAYFDDADLRQSVFGTADIRRADLSYRGGSLQEGTSVNVTATVLTGYLRAGGKILNDINNMNLSYQLNIGDVFKSPSIRNLYLEIQRKVEGDTPEDKKLTNEARLFYKFSF